MKADTKTPQPGRLVELRGTGFMKLKAVRITPDGALFKISGRNEQGKTAVLKLVDAAISGRKAFPAEPIRKGEDESILELDFEGMQIKRRIWRKDGGGFGDSLTLEYSNGKRPKEPQHVLDALRGSPIAADPIAFAMRLTGKQRFDMLKQLVPDFDFEAHAEARKDLVDERLLTGREFERAKGAHDSIVVPPGAPTKMVDVTELATALRAAGDANALIDARQRRRDETRDAISTARDIADRKTAEANKLLAEAHALNKQADADEEKLRAAEALPEKISTTDIEQQIMDADSKNNLARKAGEKAAAARKRDDLERGYDALTRQIADSDKAKAEAISKAKLPVPEISFGDDDIMLDGLPFDQASTARKVRVSTSLLMALKPELRILLVKEGSLLDRDSRAALEADAIANDFLVLMEVVSEAIDGDGVVIEDGEIV